jgi:hypothetical protein
MLALFAGEDSASHRRGQIARIGLPIDEEELCGHNAAGRLYSCLLVRKRGGVVKEGLLPKTCSIRLSCDAVGLGGCMMEKSGEGGRVTVSACGTV